MSETYCSGLRCGRKNICARWSHHLTPPLPRPLNIAQYADHAGACTMFELRQVKPKIALHPISNVERFPEDDLPLLAPDVMLQNATDFARHVASLTPAIRIKKTKQQKPKLSGKKINSTTKKKPGKYCIMLSVSGTRYEFSHDATRKIQIATFREMLTALQCPDALLREFLQKKKFAIDDPTNVR